MTVFDRPALSSPDASANRKLTALAGLALLPSVAFLFHRAAPGAPAIIPAGFAGVSGLAMLALAFTLDEAALSKLTKAVAAGVGLLVLCALVGSDARLKIASFASAAFGLGLTVWLARSARIRASVSWPLAALFAVAPALMSAYAAYLVLASRDLMIADFMTYRGIAMMVARLMDAGNWPLLLTAGVESITQDYSWAPGLVPGLLLTLTEPTSRAIYTFVILALYATPAALALAMLARDCARQAGLARDGRPAIVLALGAAAVFVAFPAAFAVAARGMPDVGGLALVVCAIRLAERLVRLLTLRHGRDECVKPMIRRVAVALALTMYALFAFRRWYAFAASGIVVMLAPESVRSRFAKPHAFAGRTPSRRPRSALSRWSRS
jgi:hypothetical protein